MNKLDHPLALDFHEFVVVRRALDGVLGHQLVLRLVRAQGRLTHSENRLVEVVHGIELDHELVFLEDGLLLGSAQALPTTWLRLRRLEQRIGGLAQRVLLSNHLALVQKGDVFQLALHLFVETIL